MKIYKSNYRNHWISPFTVLEYVFFWTAWSKCGRNRGVIEDKDYVDHPAWVESATKYIEPACRAVKWVLDLVHPQINIIRIDRWDTWSMDHTLADIILPMLRQLMLPNMVLHMWTMRMCLNIYAATWPNPRKTNGTPTVYGTCAGTGSWPK